MLENLDLNRTLSKKEYKELTEKLSPRLAQLQRSCKELGIPVMIIFEGWGASGKGTLINQLIRPLDPRGFQVFTIQKPNEEERLRPFLWRFFTKIPAKGRIHVFDRSWYQRILDEAMRLGMEKEKRMTAYEEIHSFEQLLTADGMVIIKFFLHISKEEQHKRLKKLAKTKETAWRVTDQDWQRNKEYESYLKITDEMIHYTDREEAPWTVIEATDREYAAVKILNCVTSRLEQAVKKVRGERAYEEEKKRLKAEAQNQAGTEENGEKKELEAQKKELEEISDQLRTEVLAGVDLSKTLTKEEYKKKLKKLQERLKELHNEMYLKRVPVVLAFEGWDAGGKGGAIKRITENIDPRGYEVVPTASPNDIEKAHHYLWRFWNKMPKAGHMAIFDRTWYGRVMVERIEGFCTTNEWQRAYSEINDMEAHLAGAGTIVLKFWMHIDKDEQARRFKERQETPEKQWKITDEDWRNRAKWDEYEKAVNEMLIRTSTEYAPWIIVEANSKYYARVKVLETVVNALEERLGHTKKKE
jgi:polyphosphate kinase 2 (PPK2 family)